MSEASRVRARRQRRQVSGQEQSACDRALSRFLDACKDQNVVLAYGSLTRLRMTIRNYKATPHDPRET